MPSAVSSLQYQQFVSFASTEGIKGGTILASRQGQNGDLEIVARSKGDFIGHIMRSKDTKDENDAIRSDFMKSIVDMFGVANADQLPASVKKAMKLDDYGKGKPLTARRILSVKAAVDQQLKALTLATQKSFDKYDAFMASVKAQNPHLRDVKAEHFTVDDTVKARISTALKACKGDMEAYELIKSDMFSVLCGYDEMEESLYVLSDDQVTAEVGKLLDNLAKLRQLVGHDQKLYNAMKPFIINLTPEKLECVMEAFNDLDLGDLKRLTPDASEKDIHEMAKNLNDLLSDAMIHSGVYDISNEWPNSSPKQMFASMIFAKLLPDEASARKLQASLETGPATRLMNRYAAVQASKTEAVQKKDYVPDDEELEPQARASQPAPDDEKDIGPHARLLNQLKGLLDIYCSSPQEPALRPIKAFEGSVASDDIDPDLQHMIRPDDWD